MHLRTFCIKINFAIIPANTIDFSIGFSKGESDLKIGSTVMLMKRQDGLKLKQTTLNLM